jgi:cytochrome b pre-mRNA-processing protein 3
MILSLLRKDPVRDAAEALFAAAAEAARNPVFFADWGVADTPEGRFEVQSILVILLLDRLAAEGASCEKLATAVSETMFDELDSALRELGVGDLSVGKRIRKMAEAFFGRAGAYRGALKVGDGVALAGALSRNVWGVETADHATSLAAYVEGVARALAAQTAARLKGGIVTFPAPHEATRRMDERD